MFKKFLATLALTAAFILPISAAEEHYPVVSIASVNQQLPDWRSCAGFSIGQGYIITAAHCIAQGLATHTITFLDGKKVRARFVAKDDDSDVAVLKSEEVPGTPSYDLQCGPYDMEILDDVRLEGYPEAFGFAVVVGKIAGPLEKFDPMWVNELIKINASAFSGFSGGPLINIETGKVVGVIVGIVIGQPNLGMAAPAFRVCDLLKSKGINSLPSMK